ncbi:MAG: hypothetical protein ACLP59_01480 [Bryobacteraceae bacterium]
MLIPTVGTAQSIAVVDHDATAQVCEPPAAWQLEKPRLSDLRLEDAVQGPSQIASSWLTDVRKRLELSILPKGLEAENNGQWLSEDIAAEAVSFFDKTSDLLPSEPYMYSSLMGDLVAEFRTTGGQMTGIIARDYVMLFAVVGGMAIRKQLPVSGSKTAIRRELQKFMTEMLRARQHGAVAPRS